MRRSKNYFKVHANCILVKGARRATICDLQRSAIHFIPLDLFALLSDFANSSIEEIIDFHGEDNRTTILEYFKFLTENELIYNCEESELGLFPSLSMEWHSPSVIDNAIIDANADSVHDYEAIFFQLERLGCKDVQFRFYDFISLTYLNEILSRLNSSSIKSIEIYLPYNEIFSTDGIIKFTQDHLRVSLLVFHSAPTTERLNTSLKVDIFFVKEKILNSTHCGVIAKRYFTINIQSFSEAQHYNTCLNKKISIDVNGEIRNCPSMPISYGNIRETRLEEVINAIPLFKDVWHIHKDQIKVCKDCEFRYICTDCRAYTQNGDKLGKPAKCKYNPYTATWEV